MARNLRHHEGKRFFLPFHSHLPSNQHSPSIPSPTNPQEKNHLPFIDLAYLGFASGIVEKDAFALRHFVKEGHQVMLAQSFAKNMGLYGERVGAFSIVASSVEEKIKVDSQVKM